MAKPAPPAMPLDVQEQFEACKAHLAAKYQALGIEPDVLLIHLPDLGKHVILKPWPMQRRNLAYRQLDSMGRVEGAAKLAEAVVVDCAWYVTGQPTDGPDGAVKYLRDLANLGGKYMNVIDQIGGEFLSLTGEMGGKAAGKKL